MAKGCGTTEDVAERGEIVRVCDGGFGESKNDGRDEEGDGCAVFLDSGAEGGEGEGSQDDYRSSADQNEVEKGDEGLRRE